MFVNQLNDKEGLYMELLDIYNGENKKTGKFVIRGFDNKNLNENEYISIVQIYIENDQGEFLIEKSSKLTGNKYLPVGGHVSHGESATDAIVRETKEEISFDITNEDYTYIGYIVDDFRIRNIFYLKKNLNLNSLIYQKSEVEEVSYVSIKQINDYIDKGLMHPSHKKIIEMINKYNNK